MCTTKHRYSDIFVLWKQRFVNGNICWSTPYQYLSVMKSSSPQVNHINMSSWLAFSTRELSHSLSNIFSIIEWQHFTENVVYDLYSDKSRYIHAHNMYMYIYHLFRRTWKHIVIHSYTCRPGCKIIRITSFASTQKIRNASMIWYESHFSTEHILERYISLIAVCTPLGKISRDFHLQVSNFQINLLGLLNNWHFVIWTELNNYHFLNFLCSSVTLQWALRTSLI